MDQYWNRTKKGKKQKIRNVWLKISRKMISGNKWHYAGLKRLDRRKQGRLVRNTNDVLSNLKHRI